MKTKIVANTNEGNTVKTATKIRAKPPAPSDAGMAKVRKSPNVETITRCHQIKATPHKTDSEYIKAKVSPSDR